ncbi:Carotenoid 9,10(9',10')-cleavage dioxygenase 1 [Capsicum annuum]|nr:Carotenoid 9,10(9',10')-cleavage dioxygenase 1 [Capsicum annuum]
MGRKEEGDDGVERSEGGVVLVNPKPRKGFSAKALDLLEKGIVKLVHDSSKPLHYLQGNFAPTDETPPLNDLLVHGHLPECLNGEFVRVGPNPKFAPVAGYHWFDGDGMIHGLRIKDGKATYVSRYVRTSRLKQEEFFGGAKFMKVGDLKGLFGLFTVYMQMLRAKLKVLDISYGNGTANTALAYHHGKLLALSEADKPYALKVLEDGDLQTLGMLDYDKRLTHSFTAHPKVDPVTDVDGVTLDLDPEMFACWDTEMVKNNKLAFTFDATKKARFGVLARYANNEALIKWFELPNCFIFHNGKFYRVVVRPTLLYEHSVGQSKTLMFRRCMSMRWMCGHTRCDRIRNEVIRDKVGVDEGSEIEMVWTCDKVRFRHPANAWEEGDEVVLITCRLMNPDLDLVNGAVKEKLENFCNELYEMRFNMKSGAASQKKLSESAVDFPRINENYTGRKQRYVYGTTLNSIAKVTGIIKFDLHAEPKTGKSQLEVGGNVQGIFDLGPGRFGSEAVFVPSQPDTECEEDDGFLIFFVHDENTGKSAVNVIDAKTMSAEPVAVVELPKRVPYGFHAFFVTETACYLWPPAKKDIQLGEWDRAVADGTE